ncbi:kinase-like domain-containing protein [Daedaleopsis nitida]|nr:kinase-like domain-containing protein [Daedaleopsis nitida]
MALHSEDTNSDMEQTTGRRPVPHLEDLRCITTLGDGSWGAVYLVRVKKRRRKGRLGELFALKCVEKRAYRDSERNDQREDRWEAAELKHMERRALCTLPWNPFITNLLDAYADPRNTYLLLELAPRGSIHDHITADRPMSAATAKFYFANIVFGLEFLHSHGLVHKDIKNENILIGADGYAMLADFGLSQYVDEAKIWDRMGTYFFVSPEIIGDSLDSAEAKYASDWWGAACCLFEMLTSRVPFRPSVEVKSYTALSEEQQKRNIRWPEDYKDEGCKELLGAMLDPCLSARLGARTVQGSDGSKVNTELREHPWLQTLYWDRIEARIELAPSWAPSVEHMSDQWDACVLPQQKKVPGLRLKRRRGPRFDEHGNLLVEDRRSSKRRRVVQDDYSPTSMTGEAGSTS